MAVYAAILWSFNRKSKEGNEMIKLGDLVNEAFGRTSIETPKGYDKAWLRC